MTVHWPAMTIRWQWILFGFCCMSCSAWAIQDVGLEPHRATQAAPDGNTKQSTEDKSSNVRQEKGKVEEKAETGPVPNKANGKAAGVADQGHLLDGAVERDNALSIVPESVSLAIAVRNISELTRRGDKFIDETELNVPIRLSAAFSWLVDFLNIRKGIDNEGAMALMQISPKLDFDSLVLAVPVKDFRLMAENVKIPPDQLVPGKVFDRDDFQGTKNMPYVRYVAVRGNHLLLGGVEETVEVAATAPSLSVQLPDQLGQTLLKDDILLYARKSDDSYANDLIESVAKNIEELNQSSDAKTADQLKAAAADLQAVIAGIRLDGGLGATLSLNFEGDRSRELLGRIASQASQLSMVGLPTGRVLAAHSSRGDGDKSEETARVLLSILFDQMMAWTREDIHVRQDSAIVDMFGVGWEQLNGSRTALYENTDPRMQGAFSFLAILEADDADAFVSEMASLAKYVSASALPPNERKKVMDDGEIERLIEELGHGRYRARQLAAIKLELVGRPAIDALKEIQDSRDPETRARARAIIKRIVSAEAAQRKALLKENVFDRLRPSIAFLPKQEMRGGESVSFLQLKFSEKDAVLVGQMQMLFGPQWHTVRLATVDNLVVILLGSDATVMDKALANVQTLRSDLELEDRFKEFRRRGSPNRTAEFHLSLARLARLVDGSVALDDSAEPNTLPAKGEGNKKNLPVADQEEKVVAEMTSFGMSLDANWIRFDLFAPYQDAKAIVKRFY